MIYVYDCHKDNTISRQQFVRKSWDKFKEEFSQNFGYNQKDLSPDKAGNLIVPFLCCFFWYWITDMDLTPCLCPELKLFNIKTI
jgi:hypothetical protein